MRASKILILVSNDRKMFKLYKNIGFARLLCIVEKIRYNFSAISGGYFLVKIE